MMKIKDIRVAEWFNPKSRTTADALKYLLDDIRRHGIEVPLAIQIRAAGLPEPQRQARLVPGRKFVWDFAWTVFGGGPGASIAVEVQGGVWVDKSCHRVWSLCQSRAKGA